MPRRKSVAKREILPDPKFGNVTVSKFINNMMLQGKKSLAEAIFYNALDIIADKTKEDPLIVFEKALENVKPVVEVRSKRIGGSNYQIPMEIHPVKRTALAMRWMILFARKRSERTMKERLANEIMAAYKNEGASIKKKEDTHRMAEANKAYAHFRV